MNDLPTLMDDQERILKRILSKLIEYAIGRETGVADRPYVDAVYEATTARKYSLRAVVKAIVAHPEFARK